CSAWDSSLTIHLF
nr:immunoglobulin light chain junction region [Macaca mulatta]MPO03529.1 immunoglobulin light chain junction region [Macaca mulatta]MPO04223.1 immunoglobulin light chain junction region [Macaca mulatta]MPO04456.1 immunoglobulin light chain junction region [Macaca mulatta]MPO04502.1 immunoglobulin light chain junction region [Macaca mulatta]